MAHTHSHTDERSGGKLFATIVFNVIITAAEFIGGIISGYLALIADAVHNLSDVAGLILAYIGEIGSRKQPTKKSTYGFKRLEVMTAFISAVSLVVIAIYIFYEAYHRIIQPVELKNTTILFIVATIGLIGNIISVLILHSTRKRTLNIKAAFLHMLYDAISSIAVIIGAVIITQSDWYLVDPLLSILIGLAILYSSFDVLREATIVFLEAVPRRIDYDEVSSAIKSHDKVIGLHDLHIWSLSSTDVVMSCHICISTEDYQQGPEIIRELHKMLNEKFNIGHSTIQAERDACASKDIGWFKSGGADES